MKEYLYPQNLKAQATLWLWSLRDVAILGVALLLSVVALVVTRSPIVLGIALAYGFLTIRLEDQTIMDFIKNAMRFFLLSQQMYKWGWTDETE